MTKINKTIFIAIGVGQGDAFFLEKGGMTALIDGGLSINGFSNQFQKATKRDNVDILICTHNDADHANGVLGFLQSGFICKEVWLPGSWTYRLKDLLLNPESFVEELISNVEEEKSTQRRLSNLGDQYAESIKEKERDEKPTTSPDDLSVVLEKATEDGISETHWLFPPISWSSKQCIYFLDRLHLFDHGRFQLFLEALSATKRIREISIAAYHMGAEIHWFEYDRMSTDGGNPNFLVPLNSREIIRMRRLTALDYLKLTTSNKQSLVFFSPKNEKGPAVLFSADSDLSFTRNIPWSNGMIITAPHHGSEDNVNAYKRFEQFISETGNSLDIVWVRSDGRFKRRPGNSYLNVSGRRFCTLCRGSNYPKQDVRLTFSSQKWKPISTRKCSCG